MTHQTAVAGGLVSKVAPDFGLGAWLGAREPSFVLAPPGGSRGPGDLVLETKIRMGSRGVRAVIAQVFANRFWDEFALPIL